MKLVFPRSMRWCATAALAGFAAFSSVPSLAAESLRLTGDEEVPPVRSSANGSGTITVSPEGLVSGSITTTGLTGTMAHIHAAARGQNGPVIIPLTRSDDGQVWTVPPGTRLTPQQLERYRAGELYVNVHTEANRGGEVRAQLVP
jgi:CHRD domain